MTFCKSQSQQYQIGLFYSLASTYEDSNYTFSAIHKALKSMKDSIYIASCEENLLVLNLINLDKRYLESNYIDFYKPSDTNLIYIGWYREWENSKRFKKILRKELKYINKNIYSINKKSLIEVPLTSKQHNINKIYSYKLKKENKIYELRVVEYNDLYFIGHTVRYVH